MEIERKFLVTAPPKGYEARPFRMIEQAYLCTEPVVRVRREDDSFYLTYKSRGLMAREEYNLPLDERAYLHLLKKADGQVLTKKRYLLPVEGRLDLTFELDVFEGDAVAFTPPEWCARDVTWSGEYQNSRLAMEKG